MIAPVNFPAREAHVAAVGRFGRVGEETAETPLAVQGLGQGACDPFEMVEVVAGEQVGVTQTLACETALEQLHGVFLSGELGEGHGVNEE